MNDSTLAFLVTLFGLVILNVAFHLGGVEEVVFTGFLAVLLELQLLNGKLDGGFR